MERTVNRDELQQEALTEACKYRRSGLNLSVGFGKTKIGLMYLERAGGKTLIVVPKLDIIKSWQDDAIKFGYEEVMNNCTFTTYLSLLKQNPDDYQNVILEEAHNCKGNHEPFLSQFKGNILGLTGTPPKWANSEKGKMMIKYYPIRYNYSIDDAVDNSILNDYKIEVHYLPLSTKKNIKVVTRAGKEYSVSERDQYNYATKRVDEAVSDRDKMFAHINRINKLKQFKSKEDYVSKLNKTIPEDEKVLIFCNTIEQAENLCEYSHHSKKKESPLEDFKMGNIKRLSCVEQLSEGINIPNLKHAIILHTYSNSSPKSRQKLGRLMRLSVDQTATVHILCYKDTVDVKWVNEILENFNQEKIKKYYI